MNICPHCKADPCLPLWRKLTLGPLSSARCQTCGYRIGVDIARALVAMAPTFFLVVLTTGGFLSDPLTLMGLLIVCLTLMFALYALWVPLHPDELTTASMVEEGRRRIAAKREARQR